MKWDKRQKTNQRIMSLVATDLGLECYFPGKEIIIDAYGWGELLLGVVVGAIKPPQAMLMERRIPITSFQPPNFENKRYLDDAVRISEEIIQVMQPEPDGCFRVCSEYVLTNVIKHLQSKGYRVQKVETTGELRSMVERAYLRWASENGVPEGILKERKRFWTMLDWVAEMPRVREGLVKTGWESWQRKWREEIFKRHQELHENNQT
jgi:hypothetical protein